MLKRYHIRLGCKTTAGGIVRTAGSEDSLDGALCPVEGDLIDCPACGTQGMIKCVGPRISETVNGKEFALSDDLCICRCNPPPKLVADQDFSYQVLLIADVESAEDAAARKVGANAAQDLMPLRFFDEATGRPHARRQYRIHLKGGGTLDGTTDVNGLTRLLTKAEREAIVAWDVQSESATHA